MTRASCLIATCALALAGCGSVVFDDDGAIETSSAQGATTGATGDGAAVGGSHSTASGAGEGGAAVVGQGGAAPGSGVGGGGGEGGARPLEVCSDLAWEEPLVTDVTNATQSGLARADCVAPAR